MSTATPRPSTRPWQPWSPSRALVPGTGARYRRQPSRTRAVVSITIRAVGQASRRGATRRVPNAVSLLAWVETWLATNETETLRGHRDGRRTLDGAMEAELHPAARPVRFEATDAGRLTVRAMTIPVGPGYHTYIAGLLRRLGDELGITWAPAAAGTSPTAAPTAADPNGGGRTEAASADPTNAFFSGNRADAERGHLTWLRSSLSAVRDGRRHGAT